MEVAIIVLAKHTATTVYMETMNRGEKGAARYFTLYSQGQSPSEFCLRDVGVRKEGEIGWLG